MLITIKSNPPALSSSVSPIRDYDSMPQKWQSNIAQSPSFNAGLKSYHQRFKLQDGDLSATPKVSAEDILDTFMLVEQSGGTKSRSDFGNKIRNRLKPLLDFLERYSKAIDCLVQGGSGDPISPVSLVWGLLRIVLEVLPTLSLTHPIISIISRALKPIELIKNHCTTELTANPIKPLGCVKCYQVQGKHIESP